MIPPPPRSTLFPYTTLFRSEAKWRTPLMTEYRGNQIITMPPSSWGGVPIIEMLNILEGFDLKSFGPSRSEEHTSELQSQSNLVCRLLLEKKKKKKQNSKTLT